MARALLAPAVFAAVLNFGLAQLNASVKEQVQSIKESTQAQVAATNRLVEKMMDERGR